MSGRYDPDKLIDDITHDRLHGADYLSNAALGVMVAIALNANAVDSNELIEQLKTYAKRLIAARPSMAPIPNKLGQMFSLLPESDSLRKTRTDVTETVAQVMQDSRDYREKLIENARIIMDDPKTIFTYSYSSTAYDVIKSLDPTSVITTESRPQLEGRYLAKKLGEEGISTLLVVDAALGVFVEAATACIIGADSVQYDGSCINKIGSKLLALAAREAGVPFYVVCETWKFNVLNYLGDEITLEEKDTVEVSEPMEGVVLRNPYFEVVPSHLITGVITEDGLMEPLMIRRKMEEMRKTLSPLL